MGAAAIANAFAGSWEHVSHTGLPYRTLIKGKGRCSDLLQLGMHAWFFNRRLFFFERKQRGISGGTVIGKSWEKRREEKYIGI